VAQGTKGEGHDGRTARRAQGTKSAGHEERRARRAQGTKGESTKSAGHEERRARRAQGTKGAGHERRRARRARGTKGAGHERRRGTKGAGHERRRARRARGTKGAGGRRAQEERGPARSSAPQAAPDVSLAHEQLVFSEERPWLNNVRAHFARSGASRARACLEGREGWHELHPPWTAPATRPFPYENSSLTLPKPLPLPLTSPKSPTSCTPDPIPRRCTRRPPTGRRRGSSGRWLLLRRAGRCRHASCPRRTLPWHQ